MRRFQNFTFWVLLLCLPILAMDCGRPETVDPNVVMGWVPVYSSGTYLSSVKMEAPRTMSNPGKIFVKNQYILVNEVRKGIHVIDNTDPSSPAAIAFLNIPGNLDMTMKGNTLYADFLNGILSIDISDPTHATVLAYLPNSLSQDRIRPDLNDTNRHDLYQCADTTKGVVVGWKRDSVHKSGCTGIID